MSLQCFTLIWLQFLSCNLGCAVAAVVLPVALDPEAELGRLIEPMLPPLLLLEKPLEEVEEEDLPPSTESSSSKFLSVGNTSNIDQCFIKYVHCCTLNQEDRSSSICSETAGTHDEGVAKVCSWNQLIMVCHKLDVFWAYSEGHKCIGWKHIRQADESYLEEHTRNTTGNTLFLRTQGKAYISFSLPYLPGSIFHHQLPLICHIH